MSARLHRMPNGLRVVCDPMPGLRTFALTVMVRGGARWESEAQSGWSHLLEHLVFKGAGPMDAREIVERIERRGGSINAATGQERTSFEVRGVDGALPEAMQVIADLLFHPTLAPVDIEREKDVVGQEIAEAFDAPDDHVFEMAQSQAFEGQSLGRPILGSVASLEPVDRAAIDAWRAALYAPDRMVVAVSGKVDEAELLALAEQWFGHASAPGAAEPAPARFVGGHARLSRRIEQANLVFQVPGLGIRDPGLPALRLFGEILGGGMASRLFQSAREERGLAYTIDAYEEALEDAGVVGIYAGAAADRAQMLAEVCAREIRDLAEAGPKPHELDRARAVLSAGLMMADESPTSRSARQAGHVLTFDSLYDSDTARGRVMAVTAEDMRTAGQGLLASGRTATAVLGPAKAGRAGEAFATALFG